MDKPEDLLVSGSGLITKKWTQKLARLLKRLEINSVVGGTVNKSIYGQNINVIQRHKPQQFGANWLQGSQPKLAINTGYVFASYDDDNSSYLPMRNQHPFEPKIGNTLLSASTPPTLSLTAGSTNYIYLKLTWDYFEDEIGGEPLDSNHAFKITDQVTAANYTGYAGQHDHTGYTGYESDHTHGGSSSSSGDSHRHTIEAVTTHLHTIPALTVSSGYVKIKKRTYYLSASEFVKETDQAQAAETETISYILAGYATLNGSGAITTNGTDEGARWYLEGPVYTAKPPAYISGITSQDANHRTEPVPPATPSGQTVPGIS